jgi:hypothetical protein
LAVDAALRNPTTQGVLVHAGLTTPVGNATVTVLNVRAVATPDPVAPGQRVSFALTVSNTAASSHTAHVMATVPTNTTVSKNELSLAASCDGAVNWSTCAAGQTLTFAAFNIATGASVTVVYPALVSTTAPPSNGTLLNSAVWVNDYYVGNDYQLNVAAIAASAKSVAGYPVDELPAQESAGGIVSSAKKAVAVAADHKKTRVASSAVALLPPTSSERPGTQGAAGAAIVPASPDTRVIVPLDHALIEDGSRTAYIDEGWPEFLAERLRTEYEPARRVVICPTVSETGSPPQSELADALSRSARGAETQESVGARTVGARTQGSVKYVILLERIADSSGSDAQSVEPIAQQIIARDLQLIAQAHALGLKIFGATITPFEGTTYPNHTALDEANREALNAWIRGGRAYDAIIDFDLATSDPKHPTRLLPAYDSGDHFHLNDLGYEAMADAVDLSLFDE